jgi:hypothetical protein
MVKARVLHMAAWFAVRSAAARPARRHHSRVEFHRPRRGSPGRRCCTTRGARQIGSGGHRPGQEPRSTCHEQRQAEATGSETTCDVHRGVSLWLRSLESGQSWLVGPLIRHNRHVFPYREIQGLNFRRFRLPPGPKGLLPAAELRRAKERANRRTGAGGRSPLDSSRMCFSRHARKTLATFGTGDFFRGFFEGFRS